MAEKSVIAVDLGAESGRVMRASFDGSRLDLTEVHRFPNVPVQVGKTLYWDILRLWHDIHTSLDAQLNSASSIGLDTWGVDFALLDRQHNLLANPVHYRDERTNGIMDWVAERVSLDTIFERTGIQFMQINTLFQLASLVRDKSPLLEAAATFLTIPDLLNFWLTGERACEFTIATTTQCYNPRRADWDKETLAAVGIPTQWFPKIILPGTRLGDYKGVTVIAPACHDTGSAVVAVPTTTENFAYLSSGTWSLIGLEIKDPIINAESRAANVTNEGGYGGTFRLLKNVMGMWLVQQSLVTWRGQGHEDYSYDTLVKLANEAEAFRSFIDPNHAIFLPPGDMPERIREYCKKTDQPVPESVGQIMRTIYESLALTYHHVMQSMIAMTGRKLERMHIVGGGSKNALLCQMTANALGIPVSAGPSEGTALGNAIVQYIALGDIKDTAEGRRILSQSVSLSHYEPQDTAQWQAAYERYKAVISKM